MNRGFKVTAKTNAEFLNINFGTSYKEWNQSTYDLDEETEVWMVTLDGSFQNGVKNYFENGNIIEEINDNIRPTKLKRMVFQIIENYGVKTFIYLGVYRLDSNKSSENIRIFVPLK